jgi:hypothetical protein
MSEAAALALVAMMSTCHHMGHGCLPARHPPQGQKSLLIKLRKRLQLILICRPSLLMDAHLFSSDRILRLHLQVNALPMQDTLALVRHPTLFRTA